MSKFQDKIQDTFQDFPDRMSDLADKLSKVVKEHLPDHPDKLKFLQTGMAIGAARSGVRVAGAFARRNPLLLTTVAVGGGLLYLVARHRAKKAQEAPLEGKSVRVPARRDSRVPPGDDAGDYFE